MALFHVALGANLPGPAGDATETVREAARRLDRDGLTVETRSTLYATPADPPGSGPDFVNAAVALTTDLAPDAVLARLHDIETALGRRRQARWGARAVDLDLLTAGVTVAPDAVTFDYWAGLPRARQRSETPATLILPHPRLQDRAFVLVPLAEIAPTWRHPMSGATAREMRDALAPADRAAIKPLGPL